VNYPLLNVFFTTMWIFLWILWIFLLVRVFMDLFQDSSISGWGKAGWSVLLIALPFFGVLLYLIVRGRDMATRQAEAAQEQDEQFRQYVRSAAQEGSPSTTTTTMTTADQLAHLAEARRQGDLTEEEYAQAKSKVLAS
jgi:hypothetical protein